MAKLETTADSAMAFAEPHRWRSPLLGERLTLELPQGRLEAFRRGQGPPLVFAHGWLANANLWRGVGLDDVTLVGNDSGGAYSQIAVSRRPARVARLVLTSCETPHDEFPPPPFDGLPALAREPARLRELLAALEDPEVRRLPAAFGLLVKHPLDSLASDSYALPCLRDDGVLADTAKAMAGASTAAVREAGARLVADWRKPTLLVWWRQDPVFPLAHARRYAGELTDAELVEIDDAYSFTPEDAPGAVAAAIFGFAA